jgi:hypothetical protein
MKAPKGGATIANVVGTAMPVGVHGTSERILDRAVDEITTTCKGKPPRLFINGRDGHGVRPRLGQDPSSQTATTYLLRTLNRPAIMSGS